jgi:hypothetical protein
MPRGRVLKPSFDQGRIVAQNTEIADGASAPPQQGDQRVAIGVIGAGWRQNVARRGDFVAGRKYRDPQSAPYREVGLPQRGGQRDVPRIEALAGFDRNRALGDVLAAEPCV